MDALTAFIWHRTGTIAGCCEWGNEPSSFKKWEELLDWRRACWLLRKASASCLNSDLHYNSHSFSVRTAYTHLPGLLHVSSVSWVVWHKGVSFSAYSYAGCVSYNRRMSLKPFWYVNDCETLELQQIRSLYGPLLSHVTYYVTQFVTHLRFLPVHVRKS